MQSGGAAYKGRIAFVLAALLLYILFSRISYEAIQHQVTAEQKSVVEAPSSKQIKDVQGFKHIFVDVGANCGNSYWKIKNNPDNQVLDSDDWETYLWECNPQMNKFFLRELAESDPSIHLIEKAASTEDGTMTFYLTAGEEVISDKSQFSENSECSPYSPYSPSGASTLFGGAKRAGKGITVESVNFAKWFDHLVQSKAGSEEMKVALKFDAEGSEKSILEMMTKKDASDAICKVDMLWIEYHFHIFPEGSDEYYEHRKFKNEFPMMFKLKCGRELDSVDWH